MATIGEILSRKWQGAEWHISADDYATLAWLSLGSAPSEPEIRAWSSEVDGMMAWEAVREERNHLLTESDFTQLDDAPVDKAAWAVYRQVLREIPQSFATAAEVVWPERP